MVKKRGDNKKSSKKKKDFFKKLPEILWLVLGVVITLWTVLWLLISMNSNDFGSVISVILFGAGFYAMCAFILGTLIYCVIKLIKRHKKRKHPKKHKQSCKKNKKKATKKSRKSKKKK